MQIYQLAKELIQSLGRSETNGKNRRLLPAFVANSSFWDLWPPIRGYLFITSDTGAHLNLCAAVPMRVACDSCSTSTRLLREPPLAAASRTAAQRPRRVCLYSPTAVAPLECAKQVGKLQLHSLIFSLLERGRGGGGREVVPACLPLVEWNPRIVRDHTGSRRGGGVRALKDG